MKGTLEQLYSAVEYNARHLRHALDALKYTHFDVFEHSKHFSIDENPNQFAGDRGCAACIILENVITGNSRMITQLMDEQRD